MCSSDLTDGGDAVGTSRASARRTSGPVVGIFRRFAAWVAPPGLKPYCLRSGGSRRCRGLLAASLRSAEFGRAADAAQARASPASLTDGGDAVGTSRASARRTSSPFVCPGAPAPS